MKLALSRWLFVALVAACFALAGLTNGEPFAAEPSARIAPVFSVGHYMGRSLRSGYDLVNERRNLQVQNQILQGENTRLLGENERMALEVGRLSRALAVKARQEPEVVAMGVVISQDPSGLYRRLEIGVGSRDGVENGMVASSYAGMVGVVVATSSRTATLRTLSDPESRIAVRIRGKAGQGIGYGEPPDRLRVEFPPRVEPEVGDVLVSAGGGGIFPEGIPVGTVSQVLPFQDGQVSRVVIGDIAAPISLLEEVVVLQP